MSERSDSPQPCHAPGAAPGPSRRELLAYSGAGMAGFLWRRADAAGAGQGFPIPAEKEFSVAWRQALIERGEPGIVARGSELRWIGMPVGGIGCGQVYLGGDGKLWLWDVLNLPRPSGFDSSAGPHYERPLEQTSPFQFSFALQIDRRGGGARLPFGPAGFDEIEFRGTYPIGTVTYRSAAPALEVVLEALSPFAPLELEASSLPATVLHFTLRNTGPDPIALTLIGNLDNPVAHSADDGFQGILRTTYQVREEALAMIVHYAEPQRSAAARPDMRFEDFEGPAYDGWTVEGTAFGSGPVSADALPAHMGEVGVEGKRFASSHHARAGEDSAAGNAHLGALTSREFTIERNWINLLLGGGAHPDETCVELLVDGEVVASATGRNENRMRPYSFYVGAMQQRRARLRIVDRVTGEWGSVSVDSIVFSDQRGGEPLEARPDFGTLALAVLGPEGDALLSLAAPSLAGEIDPTVNERGSVARRMELAPGATGEAVFVVAWHFPNLPRERLSFLPGIEARKRHYAAVFPGAEAVARYVCQQYPWLGGVTRGWRDTWYDSSLPGWLLDRTLASVATLATSNCFRLDDGRFSATEGAHCCPGTCTQVWQYAQAPARLFPALERDQRERVDLGLAFHEDSGQIDCSAEAGREFAVDGQAGTILRVWREHVCSADDAFLRRVYPRAKKALECLLARDSDHDGILDGAQYNMLGEEWYGAIPWLTSLFLAAVRAGEAMAEEMEDGLFAARCKKVLARGAQELVERCFDGEYFVQRLDPAHPEASATGAGCAIDQVYGQAWAHQVGLGRILPEKETRAALSALWKYNLAPDVGPYREYMRDKIPGGRWFALPGEAGLLMCTWPKGGHEVAAGKSRYGWAAGCFNECMTGLEHQVAAHMLWEGMVEKGLAVERAVHERYHPAKRNPYNEVECGDHYPRAMASYGVYLALCGFELHGPKGHLGFVPRLGPDRFRAAFTAAEGWGTYTQEIAPDKTTRALVELRYGRLRLRSLRIGHVGLADATRAEVRLGEKVITCTLEREPLSFLLRFSEDVLVNTGEALAIECRA